MALLEFEGFDWVSGTPNNELANKPGWTNLGSTSIGVINGLLGGHAVQFANQTTCFRYAIGSNIATLISGFRWETNNAGVAKNMLLYYDAGSIQCGCSLNASGKIIIWRGTTANILATGTTTLIANAWYMIEFKATFHGTTGAVEVQLNGVSECSATNVNTITTANAFANQASYGGTDSTTYMVDDYYLCDTSGSAANNFLGAIRVETGFVKNVDAVAFSALGGSTITIDGTAISCQHALNRIYYEPYVPVAGGSITSIVGRLAANLTGNINVALYDATGAGGQPGALIATATAVNNPTGNASIGAAADIVFTFSSPPSVVAGSSYYFGWMTDTTHNAWGTNSGVVVGYFQAQTYGSGFPSTASGLTLSPGSTAAIVRHWSYLNTNAKSAIQVQEVNLDGDTSYNFSSASGDVDTFSHGALSSTPATIYGVQVVATARKDDVTSQTFRTKLKSGATTSNGASRTALTSYINAADLYTVDPNTSAAWTAANVNATKMGYEHI